MIVSFTMFRQHKLIRGHAVSSVSRHILRLHCLPFVLLQFLNVLQYLE